MTIFARVAGTEPNSHPRSQLLLISGYSGVGKTALVHEIHKPITANRGYYIAGKYDRLQRNIPYYGITQAFNQFSHYLMTETAATLADWQTRILEATGSNARVLIDIIPDLALAIGPQSLEPIVNSQEAQNNFNFVFRNFVKVICQKEHPLVLFLDDLQWADAASLNLLQTLIAAEEIGYFLVIGAYRDNEVDATHPLTVTVESLAKKGIAIERLQVKPLDFEAVNQLVKDTLKRSDTENLTESIYAKTQGNAFFTTKFLKSLHEEELIKFNWQGGEFSSGRWDWDLEKIKAKDISDNVVELMMRKITRLPVQAQKILTLASCIGNQFDLKTLSVINQRSTDSTLAQLWPAAQKGLLVPLDDNYKLFWPEHDIGAKVRFKFAHDRIQQAAYNLLTARKKAPIHLQIGKLLLASGESSIFDLVNQLNEGSGLIESEKEKIQLAELNLWAAEKAKMAIAYEQAATYLEKGLELLPPNCWQKYHSLTFKLHKECAESYYLATNFNRADELFARTLKHSRDKFEKIEIFNLQAMQCSARTDHRGAIEKCFEGLNLLGFNLPDPQDKKALQKAFKQEVKTYKNLEKKHVFRFKEFPEMTDKEARAALSLCMNAIEPAILSQKNVFNLLAIKGVNLTLEYGNSSLSSLFYICLGVILIGEFQDYVNGYDLAAFGLQLNERKNPSSAMKAKNCVTFAWNLNHWMNHARTNLVFTDKFYQTALQANEISSVAYGLVIHPVTLLFTGSPLSETIAAADRCIAYGSKNKMSLPATLAEQIRRLALCLQGKTDNPLTFSDGEFNEVKYLEQWHEMDVVIGHYYARKLQVLYLSGEYARGLKLSFTEIERKIPNSYIPYIEFHFYYALNVLAAIGDLTAEAKPKYIEKLTKTRNLMKVWAETCCEENFAHKHFLIEAEIARLGGNTDRALELYDRAIASAREHRYVQQEALGNELQAKFWLAKGKKDLAAHYLSKAHYLYGLWEATAKVKDLETRYGHLFSGSTEKQVTNQIFNTLDSTSILKASQALSEEIVLEKLSGKLMQLVLENAGAQKGYLILKEGERWQIQAEGRAESQEAIVGLSIPLREISPDRPILCHGIVNYVIRTRESIVLNDAVREGQFVTDPYIIREQPKSVLCTPLLKGGKLTAILYLENYLTTGAFTPDRLELLNFLSSQAAISMENAYLYTRLEDHNKILEQKVQQRTAELAEATSKAQAASDAKSTFLANMSHELRTPLNAILGFAQLIRNSPTLPPEHQENIGIINRAGEHLLDLINQVLDLAKIEAGYTTLNPVNFDLHRLLDDLEDIFSLKAEHKRLQLLFERTEDVPRYIRTDRVKLQQVSINLLNNGLKFTKEGEYP